MCLAQFSRHIHSYQTPPNCSAYSGLQLSTDCHAYGTSQNRGDNQQLQTTNAGSRRIQDLATAFGKDFGSMAQGDLKTGKKGTNLIFVMTHEEIKNIPRNQTVTYTHVVVDFCPQKADPHNIRITADSNLINYNGELSTRTADLTTSKLMWNSVLSTEGARYMCLDIKNFYLTAPLDHYEYMKIPLNIFPEWIITQYDLNKTH
jgi:hypothetical protein